MFQIIALEGCPYSQSAVKLFEKMHGIKYHVRWISQEDKHAFKSKKRTTFPQISFLVKVDGKDKEIYIGGFEDLLNLIKILKMIKISGYINPSIFIPLIYLFRHVYNYLFIQTCV